MFFCITRSKNASKLKFQKVKFRSRLQKNEKPAIAKSNFFLEFELEFEMEFGLTKPLGPSQFLFLRDYLLGYKIPEKGCVMGNSK